MNSVTQNQAVNQPVHPFFTQAETLKILEQTVATLNNGSFNYTAAIAAIGHSEVEMTIETGKIYVNLKGLSDKQSEIWFDKFLNWFDDGQITGIGEHYFISMLQAGLNGC